MLDFHAHHNHRELFKGSVMNTPQRLWSGIRTILCLAIPFLLSFHIWCQTDATKTFVSTEYGYTARYPAGWYQNPLSQGLFIESFPPSDVRTGVRIPPGGASILLIVPQQLHGAQKSPASLQAWIDARSSGLSRKTLHIDAGGKVVDVVETRTECCAVAPFQETIEWYFVLGGRFFEADLVYWEKENDNQTSRWREVLRQVVLSIANIPEGPAGR